MAISPVRCVSGSAPCAAVLQSVGFEVFGKVQGVFFRKVREYSYRGVEVQTISYDVWFLNLKINQE